MHHLVRDLFVYRPFTTEAQVKRGRPPKPEAETLCYYDYVRLTKKQYDKVGVLAERMGGLSRAAVFRYLLEKEPA